MRSDASPATSVIMEGSELRRTLARMAHEIAERPRHRRLALVGIETRGLPLARRLATQLEAIWGVEPDLGALDIALLRRDPDPTHVAVPVVSHVALEFPVEEREVVIVDDVLFSRRTIQAALEAVFDAGRPPLVELAVLIDRGHARFPIGPDYLGREVPTRLEEHVRVRLEELDGEDGVHLIQSG